jgi:hypothetical protein
VAPEEAYMEPMGGRHVARAPWTPFYHKPRNLYNTGQAVCGARGCTRACMISLENRGAIRNQFRQPFRRRASWSVDWAVPADAPTAPPTTKEAD